MKTKKERNESSVRKKKYFLSMASLVLVFSIVLISLRSIIGYEVKFLLTPILIFLFMFLALGITFAFLKQSKWGISVIQSFFEALE